MVATYAHIQTGTHAAETVRKFKIANQNSPQALLQPDAPQWYDVKLLAEAMFDARALVRDTIAERCNVEATRRRYSGHPARQLIVAEIHGMNMHIALYWHAYRRASAAYHTAWETYQYNLKR